MHIQTNRKYFVLYVINSEAATKFWKKTTFCKIGVLRVRADTEASIFKNEL